LTEDPGPKDAAYQINEAVPKAYTSHCSIGKARSTLRQLSSTVLLPY